MTRDDVLHWLEEHRDAVHGDPDALLARCEQAVRRHATEDAWVAAKRWAQRRQHEFEAESWGAHASEAFVANEVCHQLAWELRHHEPPIEPGAEEHLAGGPIQRSLGPDAWQVLASWVREIAAEQQHTVWREIVRYTDRRARSLIREQHLSRDCDLDHTRHYPEIAADVAAMLADDYSVHAHPR